MQKYRNLVYAASLLAAGAGVAGLTLTHRVAAEEVTSDASTPVLDEQTVADANKSFHAGRQHGMANHQLPHFDLEDLVENGVIDQETADKIQAYMDEKRQAFAAEHPELATMLEGERPAGRPEINRTSPATTSTQE